MKNQNFYTLLLDSMQMHPAKIAIECETGIKLTYSELIKKTTEYAANLLSMRARPGDRVLVQVNKTPEALILYLACLRVGLVYVPLNTAYTKREVAYFVDDAEPKVIVGDLQTINSLKDLLKNKLTTRVITIDEIAVAPDSIDFPRTISKRKSTDLAVLIYTSGTTGLSKGAMLTHENLSSNAKALVESWGFSETDIILHALPIFHIHGLFVASHCPLMVGAKINWHNSFKVKNVITAFKKSTIFMGVPTYYSRILLDAALNIDSCKSIRLFISGSAPLIEEIHKNFLQRTGKVILERYGMSEAGIITSNPLKGERRVGTVGLAIDKYQIRVIGNDQKIVSNGKIGSIQIRGRSLFDGYWKMPEKTKIEFTKDRWFRTGDLGSVDESGYLTIVGREKDMIICGGYNVYPKEIEQLIQRNSKVAEVAVVGVPHQDFGEVVVAAIVLKKGKSIDKDNLLAFLEKNLANFKTPKVIFVVPNFPKNAMGKVQKNRIRDQLVSQPEVALFNKK